MDSKNFGGRDGRSGGSRDGSYRSNRSEGSRPDGNRPSSGGGFNRGGGSGRSSGGSSFSGSDRRSGGSRPGGDDRPRSPRPPYGGGGERSERPSGPRSFDRNNSEDRPRRFEGNSEGGNFRSRDGESRGGERGGERRSFGPRPGGDDRPRSPRPPYGGGERSERPSGPRSFDRNNSEERPRRFEGNRDGDSRGGERRSFGPRPGGDDRPRSPRPYGGGERSERNSERSGGPRSFDRNNSNDRPRRFEGNRDNRSEGRGSEGEGRSVPFSGERVYGKPAKRFNDEEVHTGKAIFSGEGNGQAPNYSAANLKGLDVEGDETQKETIRLNRFIANAGICSRRDADRLILEGKITVNNELVTEMGYQVQPTDVVHYNGKQLQRERNVYILLNKPKDHITTVDDPDERKTVMDIVSHACEERVYPVGRLDRNTTGLLLLTNDGELAEKLAHPSNEIQKIYQVNLDKPLSDDDFAKIVAGVTLDDGLVPVDDIDIVSPDRTIVGLEIHLGRNRIVRRLFESLGYTVEKLDRVMYAGLTKKDLPRGHYRFLTEAEVINLKFRI